MTTDWRAAQAEAPPGQRAPEEAERRRSGKAVAALVLGIVGLIVLPIVCSTLAIVLGLMARGDVRRDPGLTGETMAVWGVVLGVLGIAAGVLWFLYLL